MNRSFWTPIRSKTGNCIGDLQAEARRMNYSEGLWQMAKLHFQHTKQQSSVELMSPLTFILAPTLVLYLPLPLKDLLTLPSHTQYIYAVSMDTVPSPPITQPVYSVSMDTATHLPSYTVCLCCVSGHSTWPCHHRHSTWPCHHIQSVYAVSVDTAPANAITHSLFMLCQWMQHLTLPSHTICLCCVIGHSTWHSHDTQSVYAVSMDTAPDLTSHTVCLCCVNGHSTWHSHQGLNTKGNSCGHVGYSMGQCSFIQHD